MAVLETHTLQIFLHLQSILSLKYKLKSQKSIVELIRKLHTHDVLKKAAWHEI